MKKWVGRAFILVFFSLVMWGFVAGSLNYLGVCRKPWGILSEDEKIKIVLNKINDNKFIWVKDDCYSNNNYCISIPYKNADEIIAKNPNCCDVDVLKTFGDSKAPSTFQYRITGQYVGTVCVNYVARYLDSNGKEKSFLLKNCDDLPDGNIDNCGEFTNL